MHSVPQRSTLAQDLTRILREEIRRGVWHEILPSEAELCRSYRVSRMTLRVALQTLAHDGVVKSSQGQRRRILRKGPGRRLPRPKSRIVLLAPDPVERMAPFGLYVVDGMREQLAAAGFELEVHASRACFSESPEAALQRFTREKPAAAWALLNSTAPLQRWFMQQGLPCMLVGARHPGIELPSVATDYYSLGRHAAGHFLRRHHRHLAVLLDSERKAGHASTLAGFQAGCHPVDGAVMRVIRHDSTPQGITSCLTQMLEESPPTGILVAFPRFALAVVSSLACLGVRVPQDISIIARDSEQFLDFLMPPIAHYVIDVPLFVRKISRTVLLVASGAPAPARDQLLLPTFVPGATLDQVPGHRSAAR